MVCPRALGGKNWTHNIATLSSPLKPKANDNSRTLHEGAVTKKTPAFASENKGAPSTRRVPPKAVPGPSGSCRTHAVCRRPKRLLQQQWEAQATGRGHGRGLGTLPRGVGVGVGGEPVGVRAALQSPREHRTQSCQSSRSRKRKGRRREAGDVGSLSGGTWDTNGFGRCWGAGGSGGDRADRTEISMPSLQSELALCCLGRSPQPPCGPAATGRGAPYCAVYNAHSLA